MRVAVLFSGGKDSCFALGCALYSGWEVSCLLCVQPTPASMMFHHPNTQWTKLQAKTAGRIPLVTVKTKNDAELDELKQALARLKKKYALDGIVSGAISSEYQKQRLDVIGEELGLKTFAPLWHKQEAYASELLEYFGVHVVSVSAEGLGKEFLGARYDRQMYDRISRLSPAVNPLFEGGEAETFCADAPFFEKKIVVGKWKKTWQGQAGAAEIEKAKLEKKK